MWACSVLHPRAHLPGDPVHDLRQPQARGPQRSPPLLQQGGEDGGDGVSRGEHHQAAGTVPPPPRHHQHRHSSPQSELNYYHLGAAHKWRQPFWGLWPPLDSNLLQSVRPSKVRSDTIRLNLKMANWGLQRHLLTAPYKCLTYNRSMYCQCNVRTSTMKLLSKINHSVNEQKQKLCAPFDEFTWILIWIAVLCICMENCLG